MFCPLSAKVFLQLRSAVRRGNAPRVEKLLARLPPGGGVALAALLCEALTARHPACIGALANSGLTLSTRDNLAHLPLCLSLVFRRDPPEGGARRAECRAAFLAAYPPEQFVAAWLEALADERAHAQALVAMNLADEEVDARELYEKDSEVEAAMVYFGKELLSAVATFLPAQFETVRAAPELDNVDALGHWGSAILGWREHHSHLTHAQLDRLHAELPFPKDHVYWTMPAFLKPRTPGDVPAWLLSFLDSQVARSEWQEGAFEHFGRSLLLVMAAPAWRAQLEEMRGGPLLQFWERDGRVPALAKLVSAQHARVAREFFAAAPPAPLSGADTFVVLTQDRLYSIEAALRRGWSPLDRSYRPSQDQSPFGIILQNLSPAKVPALARLLVRYKVSMQDRDIAGQSIPEVLQQFGYSKEAAALQNAVQRAHLDVQIATVAEAGRGRI